MASDAQSDRGSESALVPVATAPAALVPAGDDPVADVYFGFSTTRIWLSRAIRAFTGAKYSHCWVLHPSAVWGGMWITHADWPVVRQWPVETASANWSVEMLYRPRFDVRAALAAVRPSFERPYDVLGLLGMIPVMLSWRWFRWRIKNPFASAKKMFCSEFVANIMMQAKLPGTESWDPEVMDPKSVEAYCAAHPELFEAVGGERARVLLGEHKEPEAGPGRRRRRRRRHGVIERGEAKAPAPGVSAGGR